jgi:hypothetical protein
MNKHGITPEDLCKLSRDHIRKVPRRPEVRDRIASQLEARRRQTVALLKGAREDLTRDELRKNAVSRRLRSSAPSSTIPDGVDLRRQEIRQQREVAQMITLELRARRTRELEHQQELAGLQREHEIARKKRQEAESVTPKAKEQKILGRVQERESTLAERKRLQDEADARRRQDDSEARENRRQGALKMEKAREARKQKLLEQSERRVDAALQ